MILKPKFFRNCLVLLQTNCLNRLARRPQRALFRLQFFSLFLAALKDYNPFGEKSSNKATRYWMKQSIPEIIQEADGLFEEERYLEVYELLNRLKFNRNVDVQWRICRVLFKMSCDEKLSKNVRKQMILEAFELMTATLSVDQNDPNVHKWMAIITDVKHGNDGTVSRVKALTDVKNHMMRAVELNPHDVIVLYMLGKWCFEISDMTRFQRFIARMLYVAPPESTYEEAYRYFLRAEEIQPRFFAPNLYMLGRACFHLKQYYKARYYLKIAAHLPARNDYERRCAENARKLAEELVDYDLTKEALLFEFPFDGEV